ncbi:hypothetical protein CVT25_000421 [Psilocybe cyanescens]|uniref:Actin cytoskeleton-regulatory complex protein PAN1 n=1 Tax=Psilocybe cyanescens TaxID=93625 RepID=A0A409XM55_PSICY|nr:hypothetical protein CVT25_000421 [Psilocybe cyanescens]
MAQWGQGQQGFQYPMQTGFQAPNQQFQQNPQFQPQNPQFQPQNPTFQQPGPQFQQGGLGIPNGGPLLSQPTGFQGQRQPGFQQPQQTGFQGGSGFLQSQPTGFPAGNFQQQNRPAPPPVPPIPSQFQQPNQQPSFLNMPPPQQPSRLMNASPAYGGGGLLPQQTGFAGRSPGPLVPQMTGFVDPRLQMMSQTFMPMNTSAPFGAGGVPQLPQQQQNLVQSIQQHNEAQRGSAGQQLSWALTKAEKKNYDKIFRSWDAQGTGFISGATALDVFGASGLPKDDLARIWTLADINDRGKLNIAEFHVAMGLIYRRLNGMPVPDQLPQELIPPSVADLDSTVDRVKELLANDSRSGSGNKHSFNSKSAPAPESRRDAANYKHSDSEPIGGYYKPSNRHVNRSAVRSREDDDSPSADLSDMRRQLESTAQQLDRASEASANRTREDEELDQEMEDLKYRVKRVKDDLDYVGRGPKTPAKEEERRRLERDLLSLLHERIPEVERKIKARDERKEKEKRQWARDRDRANDRFGRYDRYSNDDYSRRDDDRDRDRPYSRGDNLDRPYSRGGDRDRPYSRGGDDRDRPYSRGGDDRDRPYSRSTSYDDRGSYRERDRSREDRDRDRRDGGYDRPPAARSPPPPPPPVAPASAIRDPPAAPAVPKSTPSPSVKNMTAAERQAFARAEAQRRIQARMAALGVTVPSSPSDVDTTVEDRLQQEKKEAEEKARAAELQAEERERARKERLANEKALQEEKVAPAPPTPTSTFTAQPPAPTPKPTPAPKVVPAPPKPRVPPTPPVRRNAAPRPPVAAAPAPQPPAPAPPKEPEVDPEEEEWRAREAKLRKQKEERLARMRQLEQEEEEAARFEQERAARVEALKARAAKPATPPPVAPVAPPPAPVRVEPQRTPVPPPAPAPARVEPQRMPVAPPAPAPAFTTPVISPGEKSTNPFSRLIKEGSGTPSSPPTANGNSTTNPWANTPPVSTPPVSAPVRSPSIPPPSKSPAPSAVKTSYQTAPSENDDDWDDIKERDDDDDSSDDEITRSRSARTNIAQQLFGSMLPGPTSAAASAPTSSPSTPAPSNANVNTAPPPPPPPPGPPAPFTPAPAAQAASGPGDVNALLLSIQGGKKLRATKTVDRSAPPVSGRVLGDVAAASHINNTPQPVRAPSPPQPAQQYIPETTPMSHDDGNRSSNRQSVAWLADRAADVGGTPEDIHRLPSTAEEEEDMYVTPIATPIPKIMVDEPTAEPNSDLMADINKSIQHKVRSLYAFEGDGPEDLSFGENLMINANPSKSGGDWWYGTVVNTGKSGLFPKTYVEVVKPKKAKAIYTYTGNNADELPFTEGDTLSIIDTSEEEWWKTERDGVVFIVPAAYLEIVEEARERERQLVLEAAGLIVNRDVGPPPVRNRSIRRRPAPAAPKRSPSFYKDLPAIPEPEPAPEPKPDANIEPISHEARLDDAFARYESFKNTQGSMNRLSVVSTDSGTNQPSSPTATVSSMSLSPAQGQRESQGRYSHFLHFLTGSKSSTSTERERRSASTLNISAPIMNISSSQGTPKDGPSRSNSPSFGMVSSLSAFFPLQLLDLDGALIYQSWASLVDKDALDGIPPGERKRQEAIFELINTEVAYVRDLQLIVEVFYSSMLPLLSRKEITVVFANIEDLLLTNTAFVSSLEERQKDCRLYIDKIGDILLNHVPHMGVYMEYCVNQSTAIKVLQSLRDSNPELASHLQHLRDENPTILHYTEVGKEHDGIATARDMAEKLLEHINETIRDQEGYETLKKISQNLWIGQGRLDLTAPTRFMGPRRLVKQGVLFKAKSRKKLHGFLCSDILVLLDESMTNLYRMPIALAHAQVKDGGKGMYDTAFTITQAYPRGGDAVALRALSARDCQQWVHEIVYGGKRARHAEERPVRKIGRRC